MSDCQKYQDMFIDALYGELSLEDKPVFEKHLKECGLCRQEYEEMTATVDTMSQRIRPEPEAEFFDGYWGRLAKRMDKSRELVQEASWLKGELSGGHHRRLQELISDLEVILLQIANLEEESDISAIELMQDGVKSRGILFKIHLAQFKDGSKAYSEADRAQNKSKSF